MGDLVSFTTASNWNDKILIDLDEIVMVQRSHNGRDLSERSLLTLRNGKEVEVAGSVERIGERIDLAKAKRVVQK